MCILYILNSQGRRKRCLKISELKLTNTICRWPWVPHVVLHLKKDHFFTFSIKRYYSMLFCIFCVVMCVWLCTGFGATYTTILTMSFSGMCCQNAYPSRTIEPHSACLTTAWIRRARVWVLKWPESGPDVCPTENIWHVMRHIIRQLRWDWECWATTDLYDIYCNAKPSDDKAKKVVFSCVQLNHGAVSFVVWKQTQDFMLVDIFLCQDLKRSRQDRTWRTFVSRP